MTRLCLHLCRLKITGQRVRKRRMLMCRSAAWQQLPVSSRTLACQPAMLHRQCELLDKPANGRYTRGHGSPSQRSYALYLSHRPVLVVLAL